MRSRIFTLILALLPLSGFTQNTIWDFIEESGSHLIFAASISDAGLKDTLRSDGPLTLFAPTDNAFLFLPDELLEEIFEGPKEKLADVILYHILGDKVPSTELTDGMTFPTLNGDKIRVMINDEDEIFINEAKITMTNIERDNGVIHIIDALLIPPLTVWDIIVGSEDHTILEQVVRAAGLDDELSGDGPLTVFAPTDTAFAAIPPETLAELQMDPQGNLATILLYHVVADSLLSASLTDGQTATTLAGGDMDISITDEGIFVDNAKVITPDLKAANGIVHIIDNVLLATVDTRGVAYELMEINLYPNPTTESFSIDWQDQSNAPADIRLVNTSGQLVKTWSSSLRQQHFNVPELPGGIYFVEITSGNKKAVKLLVIGR